MKRVTFVKRCALQNMKVARQFWMERMMKRAAKELDQFGAGIDKEITKLGGEDKSLGYLNLYLNVRLCPPSYGFKELDNASPLNICPSHVTLLYNNVVSEFWKLRVL
jgi:hypothetical protein